MRFIIRHLTPLFRLRKRFSLIIIISLFICITFILFNINYNNQSINSLTNTNPSLIFGNKKNIIFNVLNSKTTAIIQK